MRDQDPVRKIAKRQAKERFVEANPAYTQDYNRAYYLRNREDVKEKTKRWTRENAEAARTIARHKAHRRRARRADAKGDYTESQWQARLAYYGYRCYLCGVDWFSLDSFDRTIDHVIPLSQGGTNWPANLRPACRSCNSSKDPRSVV
jgi:5-methylcytosine-specific restriction endonuclease McrA